MKKRLDGDVLSAVVMQFVVEILVQGKRRRANKADVK